MKIAIIGGGLAGLSAGGILSKEHEVILLEKQDHLGGLASSFQMEGEAIPKYYHHIVKHNEITKKYLKKYNLLDGCVWKKIKVAIGIDKKIYNVNEISGLLSFRHLSFIGKLRFGLFGLYSIFLMNTSKIPDDLDAESWLKKYAGAEVTNKVFYHLYAKNKFNTSLKLISAKQLANRLKEREIYDEFTFPPKGLQAMIDGMENEIKKNKGKIITGCNIKNINLKDKLINFNEKGTAKTIKADIIINTIPVPEFVKISKGLPADYAKKLSKLRYCPCVGITFATDDFLDKKNYWLNLFNERVQIIMQHSLLIDKYKKKINWCLRYGGSEADLPLSDDEIKTAYLKDVKKYFPHAKIEWAKVFREKYAEPVYDKNYGSYMPGYTTPLKGIYMAGIQVTYPKIRNMNSALESGVEVAGIITRNLS